MKIKVNLQTGFFENYKDLVPFQGTLKEYEDDEGRIALKASIMSEGIIHPTFIWKDEEIKYIWDGHGRQEIYQELDNDGYEIPDLPVVYIIAKNRADAKMKLLKKEQDYKRKVTTEGFISFIGDDLTQIDELQNLDLPGLGKLDFSFLSSIIKNEENISTKEIVEKRETGGGAWDSDIEAIDKVKSNVDGINANIKISCKQEDKKDVLLYLKGKLLETSFEGISFG